MLTQKVTVQINFVYADDKIYFHGAKSGYKIDEINKCNKVSLCVVDKDDVVEVESKNFADEREREGKALVGIMNLDKQITSFLTVELITDCEIVRISADVLRKLAMENIEIALVCNRMQSVASMREYEYRKMILTCNPVQRYEYFLETYPGLEKYDGA